jgi:U3 small nucleolar RNA-associated protein 23
MRAKRSKKYRKTMTAYQQAFGFRAPYQVLCDTSFFKATHAFHMPVQKYLDNTLHAESRPYVTQCTLAVLSAEHEKNKIKTGDKRLGGRHECLPPPTEVPLRYCKHKDEEGNVIPPEEMGEERCLLDLLGGQVKGNEVVKNKQHYVLATADRSEEAAKRARSRIELREKARMIPGVPIVYVKRSVMILEELSGSSEMVRSGAERDKFKAGLILPDARKRKRGDMEDEDADPVLKKLLEEEDHNEDQAPPRARGAGRPKGPNPLSVKKKKVKVSHQPQARRDSGSGKIAGEGNTVSKKKSHRGSRGKRKKVGEGGESIAVDALVDTAET